MLLYPNCPGCKCAHLRAKGAGPPVKELLMTSIVVLCNAMPISSLFPFLYFMVEDFHIAKMREDIGYYAGAIGSVFMFGRFLSAVPWGVFADKYGRRPVSHKINSLSFGEHFPGKVNPLDGVERTQQSMNNMYRYFIKVPTSTGLNSATSFVAKANPLSQVPTKKATELHHALGHGFGTERHLYNPTVWDRNPFQACKQSSMNQGI